MKSAYFLFAIFVPTVLLGLTSCEGPSNDIPDFYEYEFKDSQYFSFDSDTISITVVQPYISVESDTTTYQPEIVMRESQSLSNQIYLEFTVQAGTYSEKPNPVREFHVEDDSLRIWYGGIESPEYYRHKQRSSTDSNTPTIQTSLAQPTYTIKKIELHHQPDCSVTFNYHISRILIQ